MSAGVGGDNSTLAYFMNVLNFGRDSWASSMIKNILNYKKTKLHKSVFFFPIYYASIDIRLCYVM